jgi:L-ascorbate metabolism protein UlaG (beta-lactamase superfamily)
MPLTLTFLGHSAVLLEDTKHTVVIDPFLTGNPAAAKRVSDIHAKHIVVTHGHNDHLGDALAIARANKGTIYAPNEVALYAEEQGAAAEPYEGRYMGAACGAVVRMDGATVYHCGDTGLFSDMRLLGEIYRPDIALIPIGDRYTMGPELASRAAELIMPKIAVPIHFGSFPVLVPDASGFQPKGVDVRVLKPGESLRYG